MGVPKKRDDYEFQIFKNGFKISDHMVFQHLFLVTVIPHAIFLEFTSPSYLFLDWYKGNRHKCRRHEHTAPGNPLERRSRAKLKIAALKSLFFLKKRGITMPRIIVIQTDYTYTFLKLLTSFLTNAFICACLDFVLSIFYYFLSKFCLYFVIAYIWLLSPFLIPFK